MTTEKLTSREDDIRGYSMLVGMVFILLLMLSGAIGFVWFVFHLMSHGMSHSCF